MGKHTNAEERILSLIAAAETGAVELIRAGKGKAGRELLAACANFRTHDVGTAGILRGNADLVPAQHAYLADMEDRL